MARYSGHRERVAVAMASVDPATAVSLSVRLDALEADQRARQAAAHE